jgi:hypothetical protein
MARPQCDTPPLVSIGRSLHLSKGRERERANGKKKAGRKEGRKKEEETMKE